MKAIAAVVVAASVLLSQHAWAQQEASAIHRSQEAARAWLDLVDSGQYAASWDEAARPFQLAVTSPAWVATIQGLRQPLGPVRARWLKSARYSETLPGAPPGQYVVLQYETRFENRVSAVETVVPMMDENRIWRVSGYFIN